MTLSSTDQEQLTPKRLPYAFAKRHGVLIGQVSPDHVQVFYYDELDPRTLGEVRRIIGRPIKLNATSAEQFDALLTQTYERDSGQTMAMMEGVSDELDLDQLAETIEPEDLLEAEDDAPIIKLINAILSEAIKINDVVSMACSVKSCNHRAILRR